MVSGIVIGVADKAREAEEEAEVWNRTPLGAGLLGQAQASVGPWKGEERLVCEGARGRASATVVRVYNTAVITIARVE